MESQTKTNLKERFIHESRLYIIYTIFFLLFFWAFSTYRRLLLNDYEDAYISYSYSLIESMILAKIILLGQMLRIGSRFNDKPLALTSLYKAFCFSLFVLGFMVAERFVIGFFHKKSFESIYLDLIGGGKDQILAKILVMFFTFILFFALLETGRVIGEDKMIRLFLYGRDKDK